MKAWLLRWARRLLGMGAVQPGPIMRSQQPWPAERRGKSKVAAIRRKARKRRRRKAS